MKDFIGSLILRTFFYSIFPVIILLNYEVEPIIWFVGLFILVIFASYGVYSSAQEEYSTAILNARNNMKEEVLIIQASAKKELDDQKKIILSNQDRVSKEAVVIQEKAKKSIEEAYSLRTQAEKERELWKTTMLERNAGFKTLLSFVSYFEKLRDEPISNYLLDKKHPAYKAAELVKEQAEKRREAEFNNRRTQAIIEMYEQYAPFLIELKDDIPDVSDVNVFQEYSEEERQDSVVNYLTKEEYRKLPTVERNQLALDRFWSRPKSKWFIGKLYERYIGYLYEQKGYSVEYFGIDEKYEDMGRDLICRKDSETLIIQCKHWAGFRTIYEKHIFQLFGTFFEYKETNPSETVKAIFYTSTQLSPLARKISSTLGIELFEDFKLDKQYPCIKCNISTLTNERIYHLPFDQKYDDTKIDRKGEMYCATVAEAENVGFRRAFRWHSPDFN